MSETSPPFNEQFVDLSRVDADSPVLTTHQKSTSAHNDFLGNLTGDKLEQAVKQARSRAPDSERLKTLLRSNNWSSKHPIRKNLWKCLIQTSSNKENNGNSLISKTDYENQLNHIFGKLRDIEISLPEFVYLNNPNLTATSIESNNSMLNGNNNNNTTMNINSSSSSNNLMVTSTTTNNAAANLHFNYYNLNQDGKQAVKRILCVYEYQYPQITYAPGLVSICSLLLHYMQEHEVYAALCNLSSTKEHLIESKSNWDLLSSVFIRLLKNYCKSSYEILAKYATESLEVILGDWYWWIFDCLSFEYLIRIMDCYLFEGQKVFFRVSLSIVQQFTKYIALLERFESIHDYYVNVAKSQNLKITKSSIRMFCDSPSSLESIDRLLKMSFSIRNLKRSTIRDYYVKEELRRKNLDYQSTPQSATGSPNNTIPLIKIDTNNNLNAAARNHSRSQLMNESAVSDQQQLQQQESSLHRIFLTETNTGILTHSNLSTIWNWIPQRLSVYTPTVLFTTQEHGTSMNTLFNVLDELEHCLIVIKTFDEQIFGAFCSGAWNDRKQKVLYFGNGETFLFTIAPEKRHYKWVGTHNQTLNTSQELFLRVDPSKIVIGGGHNGLAISSNLTEGYTGRCDTFENEPLCSMNHFQIAVLEVIGFGNNRS